MSELVERKDLTRWNRAGLERFRYVDGNAVTYLEALRQAMVEAFTEAGSNRWSELESRLPIPEDESQAEKQARWQQQYHSERRDHAWEILRSYARASHVLLEHCDAYANEKYLRTASQWQNVKRLVEMLDYHPAPPASAETPIALLAKEGASGELGKGFAFKNKPVDGGKPAVFETLEDLAVDAAMNRLRFLHWNKSQAPFDYDTASGTATFSLAAADESLAVGNIGVLVISENVSAELGLPVEISRIDENSLQLTGLDSEAPLPPTIYEHQVGLWLKPSFQRKPQIGGTDAMVVEADHGLSAGAAVAWKEGSYWKAAFVREVDVNRVRLSRSAPAAGTSLYATAYSDRETYEVDGDSKQRIILPAHLNDERIYGADWDENLDDIGSHKHEVEGGSYIYDYIEGTAYNRIYYVSKNDPVSTVAVSQPSGLSFDGKAKGITSGDWLLARMADASVKAVVIDRVEQFADSFSLTTTPALGDVDTVFGDFALQLHPADFDKNQSPAFLTDADFRSDQSSILALDPESLPELLQPGRRLILAAGDVAMELRVKRVDRENGHLVVTPAIPGSEPGAAGTTDIYSRHASIIYGNVARAGQGESQQQKVLGSGDATRSNQTFHYDHSEISFVSDGSFPPGVRADIEIEVEGRTWQQVASLNDSAPEEPHYLVRMLEDGTLNITFGDGSRGRRLPSGNNNVRIRARKGTGLAGNLDAWQLKKEVKPHYLVDEIHQPVAATGGNDMEAAESMRNNAPASVLTLERAVSLPDFVHLAKSNSSVWDAAALSVRPGLGRSDKIKIAVLPAGGGALGSLQQTLDTYLRAHALPRVDVAVQAYRAILLDLDLLISVKTEEYDPLVIAENVRTHLLGSFSLSRARLGRALYRSEIVAAAEAVAGVENALCTLQPRGFLNEQGETTQPMSTAASPAGALKRVTPAWDQVIHAHEAMSMINVATREFSI